jgi:site-specific DNA recombinase
MSKEPEKKRLLVCAIYTRKSTSEGLEQEFTSLDNQRESAENYIKSQQHEGWTVCKELYDDGGFTGANIERPGLQRLLAHIKEGRVNCVVVYKVDRLSRSLLDFSQLLEFFDKNNVVFVSVTQQFNTNTSMGRLTLNILLSFAQFEREIISERTKDKMGAARRRGQWLGGRTPFGYNKDETTKKLTILSEEADIIKEIFELYLRGNSTREVANIINNSGIKTREYTAKSGKKFGKNPFTSNRISYILHNYTYLGKVEFDGKIYDDQQPSIIDEATFVKAQRRMGQYKTDHIQAENVEFTGLLTGILQC